MNRILPEQPEVRRRRLQWQCRRGMRELDELLHAFMDTSYDGMDSNGLRSFEALLDYPDSLLLELLMGRMTAADRDVARIVREIRNAALA